MRIYLAGPLFSEAERAFLSALAARLRAAGFECFVPHEQESGLAQPSPASIFSLDYERGLKPAHALVAWLDGPQVDDGTACEIGLFHGLLQATPRGCSAWSRTCGCSGACPAFGSSALNPFVAGAIESAGRLCWSVDEVLEQLLAWRRQLDERSG